MLILHDFAAPAPPRTFPIEPPRARRDETIVRLARIASIPHVVAHAARLRPTSRLAHVAFVCRLATCRGDLGGRAVRAFLEDAYRATTKTAHRVAGDLSASRVWEEWEGRCLVCACATLAGRLRVALTLDAVDASAAAW